MSTAHASTTAASPSDAFRDAVNSELVRHLYRQAPASMVAILVVSAILAYALWGITQRNVMLAWLSFVVLVVAFRFVQIRAFRRRSIPDEQMLSWARRSAFGSALIGSVWALASVLFLDPQHPLSLIAITVIVMGISAGSVVNLASYLPSFLGVVGPAMLALIGVLLWHGDSTSNTIAVLSAVASMAYIVGARNVHRLLVDSLRLGFENVALISELKRRESALETARRNAEQANAAKTRFLAAASHDLRQPIHALGLLFATLSDRVRSESTAPILGQIDTAVDAIDFMLNSLLDISKLDAGVLQPDVARVDLQGLLGQLESEYQPVVNVTGNRLKIRSTPVCVLSDASMLHRILSNLLSNALRYTAGGRVLVGTRRRGDSIRIDVCDTGPGIPAEALDDIFLEFHQLGNPERDRRKGLGLGLAIVKRLAELLAHEIEVRSVPGRGSRFSITLPLTSAEPAALPARAEPASWGPTLRDKRVLVLDDDTAVLDAMRALLERWGCTVTTCATPEEAEQRFVSPAPPHLLIVDYRLRHNASGIETIGRLQAQTGHRIPALVITGDTAPDRLREAQRSGYPLLHKPVKPPQLHMVMRQILQASLHP